MAQALAKYTNTIAEHTKAMVELTNAMVEQTKAMTEQTMTKADMVAAFRDCLNSLAKPLPPDSGCAKAESVAASDSSEKSTPPPAPPVELRAEEAEKISSSELVGMPFLAILIVGLFMAGIIYLPSLDDPNRKPQTIAHAPSSTQQVPTAPDASPCANISDVELTNKTISFVANSSSLRKIPDITKEILAQQCFKALNICTESYARSLVHLNNSLLQPQLAQEVVDKNSFNPSFAVFGPTVSTIKAKVPQGCVFSSSEFKLTEN